MTTPEPVNSRDALLAAVKEVTSLIEPHNHVFDAAITLLIYIWITFCVVYTICDLTH